MEGAVNEPKDVEVLTGPPLPFCIPIRQRRNSLIYTCSNGRPYGASYPTPLRPVC
jgi:hypothetical protein